MKKRILLLSTALVVGIFITGLIKVVGTTEAATPLRNWEKSVSIVPRSSTDFSSDSFKQSFHDASSIGVNMITLVIPYYQSSITASSIEPGWNTPTDNSLADAIQ